MIQRTIKCRQSHDIAKSVETNHPFDYHLHITFSDSDLALKPLSTPFPHTHHSSHPPTSLSHHIPYPTYQPVRLYRYILYSRRCGARLPFGFNYSRSASPLLRSWHGMARTHHSTHETLPLYAYVSINMNPNFLMVWGYEKMQGEGRGKRPSHRSGESITRVD